MIVLLTECYATLMFSVLLKVVLTFEFVDEMFECERTCPAIEQYFLLSIICLKCRVLRCTTWFQFDHAKV